MIETVDVAVVGAGPAGSAAALMARRRDPSARVLLVDRATFPRDKPCGDGIGPEGLDLLSRLQVADTVLDGYPAVPRIRITGPTGREVVGTAPRPGRVIPRAVFDARLRDCAIAAGAEGGTWRVRRIERVAGGVVLNGRVRARCVVAADGANSTVRRLVGLDRSPRRHTGIAIRGYVDGAVPGLDPDTLWIGFRARAWPAYAWAFPTGTGVTNVGYGPFDGTAVSSRSQLLEGLAEALPGVTPRDLRAHHLPLSTARPPMHVGRVLFVGDAASLVNPLTGEGIAYGLLSGALAGAAAVTQPARPGPVYRSALQRRLGRHFGHTTVGARMARASWTVDAAVEAARQNPRVLADLTDYLLASGLITARMALGMTGAAVRTR